MHALTVLKCSNIVNRLVSHEFFVNKIGRNMSSITLKVDGQEWTIKADYFRCQVDGHSCGPIACMKVTSIFNCIESQMLDDDVAEYCNIVAR